MNELPNLLGYVDASRFSIDWFILAFAFFMIGIFIIYSAFLVYHALRYGNGYFFIYVSLVAYFGVSLILITSMLSAAVLLT